MYANFGALGGILGTFVYGLVIGLAFRYFVRRARWSPAWWAWAPFLLFTPLSAEQEITAVINQITRAALVMIVLVAVLPGWRELPRARRRRPVTIPEPDMVPAP